MKTIRSLTVLLLSFALGVSAQANEDKVRDNLARILPANMQIGSIAESVMENVYIVSVGSQEMYVYSSGDYILVGDVYDSIRRVSLGDERKNQQMAEAIASIPESEMILMGAPTGRYVTIFTDTDCVYCQRFHKTVPELQQRGLQVRYLMFPRAGIGSDSYNEAVSVWCSENQAEAITLAKAGGIVAPKSCENPVEQQYRLGQDIGVRGTPTMILDSGEVIPGFVEPDELLARLGMEQN
jgi:thiol:disulfide interchange protein DsbC